MIIVIVVHVITVMNTYLLKELKRLQTRQLQTRQ